MSREKGRTRQGKKKTAFFATKGGSNAVKSPRKNQKQQRIKMQRDKARDAKHVFYQDAGVIAKPTTIKKKQQTVASQTTGTRLCSPAAKKTLSFATPTKEEESDTVMPRSSTAKTKTPFQRRLSAMSPFKLFPLKKKTSSKPVPPVVVDAASAENVATLPKTPAAKKLPTALAPSSIVKLWSLRRNNDDSKESTRFKSTTTPKKPSLLPKPQLTPVFAQEPSLVPMPSAMASPIVTTWDARRRSSSSMTPLSRYTMMTLPALFSKNLSLDNHNGTSTTSKHPKEVDADANDDTKENHKTAWSSLAATASL